MISKRAAVLEVDTQKPALPTQPIFSLALDNCGCHGTHDTNVGCLRDSRVLNNSVKSTNLAQPPHLAVEETETLRSYLPKVTQLKKTNWATVYRVSWDAEKLEFRIV